MRISQAETNFAFGRCTSRRCDANSGEQIQHVLIFPAITHQIIQHENPRSQVFGEQALNVFRDAMVEMNSFAMHVPETPLGFSVAVHDLSDGSVKSTGSGPQELSGKCRFAALTGSRHNDAARRFKIGIIVRRSHPLSNEQTGSMNCLFI